VLNKLHNVWEQALPVSVWPSLEPENTHCLNNFFLSRMWPPLLFSFFRKGKLVGEKRLSSIMLHYGDFVKLKKLVKA
jgi:hypothetical protein